MAEAPNGAVETAEPQTNKSSPPINTGGAGTNGAGAPVVVPAAKAVEVPNAGSSGSFAPVLLKKRYKVYPDNPLPELDGPSAKAFKAEDQRDPSRAVYALVCPPGLPPRAKAMKDLKSLTIHGMLSLVEFGPISWEPLGQRAMLVIFERPLGGRLIDAFPDGNVKVSEYELAKKVIDPIAQALEKLRDINTPHRSIRIDNLYFLDEDHESLVLGDCVTTPPAYDQPTIHETVERGLAMNSGRGNGNILDDLYSLGVMSALLLFGHNPTEKLSDDELNAKKMEQGSYQTICGDERVSLALIEPLRGLLADDATERWDIGTLDVWINGQKKTPMQKRPTQKPNEPAITA